MNQSYIRQKSRETAKTVITAIIPTYNEKKIKKRIRASLNELMTCIKRLSFLDFEILRRTKVMYINKRHI